MVVLVSMPSLCLIILPILMTDSWEFSHCCCVVLSSSLAFPCSFLTSIGRDGGSLVRCRGIWVDSSSFISHISNIANIAISLVSNMLCTAIRKSNGVRSLSISGTIASLSSVESGVGVVISYSIGVSVWGDLIRVGRLSVSLNNWGMVSRSSMDNGGMVGRGSMDNRGSMVDRGSMISWSMSKDSLSSMKTVRRVSNSCNSSSESLGLSGAPVLSLVRLGY